MFRILPIVSKRSKSFRQSNFGNCSLVGASCLLFSLTRASSHRIAIITPTITIVMGRDESGKPMESSSPESQINTRLLRSGYHQVCSKQWQGNSSCVNMMLLQLRFPEASSFSYSLHPQLRNAPGICSCTLELMSIPPKIVLLIVYDKFHCVGCSFPIRSLPSIFLCAFAQFAKTPGNTSTLMAVIISCICSRFNSDSKEPNML